MNEVRIEKNLAGAADILRHLISCGPSHRIWIEKSISIQDYSNKLASEAQNLEIWKDEGLIALVSYYVSFLKEELFITNVSVDSGERSRGLATILMKQLIEEGFRMTGISQIRLQVEPKNIGALRLYQKLGFLPYLKELENNGALDLVLDLNKPN